MFKKISTILVSILMLLSIFGCNNEQVHDEISSDDQTLTESMHNFFALKSNDYVKGEHFQVKVISFAKIYYKDKVIYKYSLAIAPKLDEKMNIENFKFTIVDADKYFVGNTMYSIFSKDIFEKGQIPEKNGKSDMVAYRFELFLDNIDNEYQKSKELTDDKMDDFLSKVVVKIDFNNTSEKIEIDISDILVINEDNDIPEGRVDLYSFLHNGTYGGITVGPYDNDVWEY